MSRTNRDRGNAAFAAVCAYLEEKGESDSIDTEGEQTVLADLLADLMHWAANTVSCACFGCALDSAMMNYEAEAGEENDR